VFPRMSANTMKESVYVAGKGKWLPPSSVNCQTHIINWQTVKFSEGWVRFCGSLLLQRLPSLHLLRSDSATLMDSGGQTFLPEPCPDARTSGSNA
jgi:hypothetical protein